MSSTKAKRKKIEELVTQTFKALDKTGKNSAKYAGFFKKMTDAQFEKWAKSFFSDEDENFFLECTPYESEPSMADISRAAKFLGIPLKERVTFRHLGGVKTKKKVPVGFLNLKRHQQIVSKKNSLATGIRRRNQKTGQVIGDSKAARLTDLDNYSLQTIGAEAALSELMGPRADDMRTKTKMYESIRLQGFSSQQGMKSASRDKTTLNTLNVLLLGAGIQTDLVNNSLLLPITAEGTDKQDKRDKKNSVQGIK